MHYDAAILDFSRTFLQHAIAKVDPHQLIKRPTSIDGELPAICGCIPGGVCLTLPGTSNSCLIAVPRKESSSFITQMHAPSEH